jgi:hypothetical protein
MPSNRRSVVGRPSCAALSAIRAEQAKPVVEALRAWLESELHRVSRRSGLADAIRYALVRWDALCRYLKDGRVELDTNTVERVIRPIALGRKNHLFAGSDGGADRWAIVYSLITTAKLNDREPYAYPQRFTHFLNRKPEPTAFLVSPTLPLAITDQVDNPWPAIQSRAVFPVDPTE